MTLAASGISPVTYSAGSCNIATGTFTGDGSGAFSVALGFTPVYVELIDMAASTGSSRYTWIQGMAATDSLLTNGTTDIAIDANSAVVTNGKLFTQTSSGVYAPGTQSADDGSIINSGSISVYGPDQSKSYRLQFGINVSSHTYVWVAMG